MAKMNNSIEKIFIKCDHCGENFSLQALYYNAVSNGLIFLVSNEHGYIGILCPKCNKTTLKKDDLSKIQFLKDRLVSIIGHDNSKKSNFRYNSFPYNSDYLEISNSKIQFHSNLHIGRNSYGESEFRLHISHKGNSKWYSDGYRSYFWGDLSIGSAMIICWFLEEDIQSLISIENETGLKIFPRYIVFEPIYSSINSFCWEYYLKFDYLEKLNSLLAKKEKATTPPKILIAKSYEFTARQILPITQHT